MTITQLHLRTCCLYIKHSTLYIKLLFRQVLSNHQLFTAWPYVEACDHLHCFGEAYTHHCSSMILLPAFTILFCYFSFIHAYIYMDTCNFGHIMLNAHPNGIYITWQLFPSCSPAVYYTYTEREREKEGGREGGREEFKCLIWYLLFCY